MAVQKGEATTVKDFADLGQLTKPQTTQQEGTMPNSKKTATAAAAASIETMLTPEAILAKAEADGFDISQAHPLVTEFVSALNPYGPGREEDGSRWVLTLASNDPENPMPIHDFIVESYRDPTRFIMQIANNQGSRNAQVVKKTHELVQQSHVVATENRNLKEEVKRLNAKTQQDPVLAAIDNDFRQVIEEAGELFKTGVVSDINEAKATNVAPIDVISRRPTKPVTTVPEKVKLMTVRVEEPTFWETATKAVVTGVVVGAAAYGTIKALEYFFGDDE